MRICFFIGQLSGGGAESVCINIANNFADSGLDLTILTVNGANDDLLCRIKDKVRYSSLNRKNARYALPSLLDFIKKNTYSLPAKKPLFLLVF